MKVSGFTFVRNGIKYDYPFVEAIQSVLLVCDELIVAVGISDDGTREAIERIGSSKIKILDSIWNNNLREGGTVYATEAEKAFHACSPESTWCFYFQADEVFHEQDLPLMMDAMKKWKDDKRVEGLLFDHLNFYCTYEYYANARHWQKKEIRIIRNDHRIRSYTDAASFRFDDGRKLNCKYVPALIYHYGWVREPLSMLEKKIEQNSYHSETVDPSIVKGANTFDYSIIASVAEYKGTHPSVMAARIKKCTWTLDLDKIHNKESFRRRALDFVYQKTGWHIGGFKNYKLI